jgi:hypothetical protein
MLAPRVLSLVVLAEQHSCRVATQAPSCGLRAEVAHEDRAVPKRFARVARLSWRERPAQHFAANAGVSYVLDSLRVVTSAHECERP